MSNEIYDLAGIGIGPFNLGLAALCHPIPKLKVTFIDQRTEFNWHPGLMLDHAKLQVPFYADLVTLADPRSHYSFLSYLKAKERLFRFAIRENNFMYRKEYNDYCRWVAGQLPSLHFGMRCEAINLDEGLYKVVVKDVDGKVSILHARNLVIGVGTVPNLPEAVHLPSFQHSFPKLSHSSDYLRVKEALLKMKSLTIVGSGQSAAEIFADLLPHHQQFKDGLYWFTSSDRFYPMDYSKFALEMSSPEYIDHFFHLPKMVKPGLLRSQSNLYKGINEGLIADIYEELYRLSLSEEDLKVELRPGVKLAAISGNGEGFRLSLEHRLQQRKFEHGTEAVIFATGYKVKVPDFLKPVKDQLQWDEAGNYKVGLNYSVDRRSSIFVQNAELHTHGFNAADLGMGPYRNAVILEAILGYAPYHVERGSVFQRFGTGGHQRPS